MAPNRPRGRQRNVSGAGKSINRRGAGLGTGPVGSSGGYSGRPGGGSMGSGQKRPGGGNSFSSGRRNSGGNVTRSGNGGGMMKFIIIALVILLGGGGGVGSLLSNDNAEYTSAPMESMTGQSSTGQSTADYLNSIYGNLGGGSISNGWNNGGNIGTLDTSVATGAREKYIDILGNGEDKATIMVYLCGTDLESRSKWQLLICRKCWMQPFLKM